MKHRITSPTGNALHVTFMYHAIIIDLHALHNMHVVMLMYMNFGRFPCMLHAYNMITNITTTCMLYGGLKHDHETVLLW